jgi:hypothetical protein
VVCFLGDNYYGVQKLMVKGEIPNENAQAKGITYCSPDRPLQQVTAICSSLMTHFVCCNGMTI